MSWPEPGHGGTSPSLTEEWVVTVSDGLVTKIERVNPTTRTRTELSAEEYAALAAGYYTAYYAGIRDYAQAIAAGNTDVAMAYYRGMTQYFAAMGST